MHLSSNQAGALDHTILSFISQKGDLTPQLTRGNVEQCYHWESLSFLRESMQQGCLCGITSIFN